MLIFKVFSSFFFQLYVFNEYFSCLNYFSLFFIYFLICQQIFFYFISLMFINFFSPFFSILIAYIFRVFPFFIPFSSKTYIFYYDNAGPPYLSEANPRETRFASRYREVRETEGSRNRDSTVRPAPELCLSRGGGGTPLFGLYGDVLLDRVWFFGLDGPKQGVQFDLALS